MSAIPGWSTRHFCARLARQPRQDMARAVAAVHDRMAGRPGAEAALDKLLHMLDVTRDLNRAPRVGGRLSEFEIAFLYWYRYDLTDAERVLVSDWLEAIESVGSI